MTNSKTSYDYEDFEWLISIARAYAGTWQGRSCVDDINFVTSGYKEPGYTDPESGIIVTGNWNKVTEYDEQTRTLRTTDDVMSRLVKIFEALDVEIEWGDEWTECSQCYGIIRTSPDSYCWSPSYVVDDCEIICTECLRENAEEHFESLEGDSARINTIDLDPDDHGYVLIEDDFQHGFHRGQDASPQLIGQLLSKAGFERFLFNLDSKGQFDMSFSVWLHEDEAAGEGLALAKRVLEQGNTDGPSVAAAMERRLREASLQADEALQATSGGIVYQNVTPDSVETKIISQEDLVKGKI